MEARRNPPSNAFPNFSMKEKRVAVELWNAKVSLKRIREQLGMSEATLRRVLGHAKKNPSCPVKKRKPGSGKKKIISPETLRGMQVLATSQYVARTPSTPKSFNKKRLNLFLLYFSKDRSLSRAGTVLCCTPKYKLCHVFF